MAGGPMVNLVLAFLLFGGVFMVHGVPSPPRPIDEVSDCVIAATRNADAGRSARAPTHDPVAPASEAGIAARRRDRRRSTATPIDDWDQFSDADPRQRRRRRRDRRRARRRARSTLTHQHHGLRAAGPTTATTDVERRASSASRPSEVLERQGPVYVDRPRWATTPGRPVKALGAHAGQASTSVAPRSVCEERDRDSPMSVVGASRVAGEVASDDAIAVGRPVLRRCSACSAGSTCSSACSTSCRCCRSTAATSPARSTRRSGAAWPGCRGRPDPGYFDVAKLLPVAYVMAGAHLVMSVC